MKYINKYGSFINEEFSKNDPIPELNSKEKLGVILLGIPGAGKSTFIKNNILNRNINIKTFSTDDISFKFTKDANKYHIGSAELNITYLKSYTSSNQNFIYDTTGANDKAVFDVCKLANNRGYKLVFILILIDLETAKSQNLKRGELGGHMVDDDYIDFVYSRQLQTTKDYLKLLKHENFYIVLNKSGKYKYFKHTGNQILKRKVDKYIPMVKESKEYTEGDREDDVDYIMDCVQDLIDDNFDEIKFKSFDLRLNSNAMSPKDYLDKNEKYSLFKPINKVGNKIRSNFQIVFNLDSGTHDIKSYDNMLNIINEMSTAIARLKDKGWDLFDLKLNTDRPPHDNGFVLIKTLTYGFSKKDIVVDDNLPSREDVVRAIENFTSVTVEDCTVYDNEVLVEFYTNGEYISKSIDDEFGKVCDVLGFDEYEYSYNTYSVTFFMNK